MTVRFQADANLNHIILTTATSTGVLIVSQPLPVAAAVDDLLLIWHTTEAEEWINPIRSLPL